MSDFDQLHARIDLAGKRVLDVGAGAGALVRWLRTQGADPVGAECGEVMLGRALANDPDNAGSYVGAVGQDLPFDAAEFDVVVFSYSLHHVPEHHMASALTEAHRVLRPGGILYVTEPIAAGPSYEVCRLVDDESAVRALAQAALAAAPALGFTAVENSTYPVTFTYTDVAAWEHEMVGIDPTRAAAMEAARDQVGEAFEAHGTRTPSGWTFAQDINVQVFTKD